MEWQGTDTSELHTLTEISCPRHPDRDILSDTCWSRHPAREILTETSWPIHLARDTKQSMKTITKDGIKWATTWQNQQSDCAPSEDSDQPGHPPSLIRVFAVRMPRLIWVFAVHMKKAWVLNYPLSAQRRLWSDWALGRFGCVWLLAGVS